MSLAINSDLQCISQWGTHNLVKFNTSNTGFDYLCNTPSNYLILFEDQEILPHQHLRASNIFQLVLEGPYCTASKKL